MKKKITILAALLFVLSYTAHGISMPFIPKLFQDMPDNYGIKVFYVSGKEENFEIAEHNLNKDTGTLEFVTKDDLWNWIPISSIQRLEFDKRFSKIIDYKEKQAQKQKENQDKQNVQK